jgi:hypothetical protein
VHVSIAIFSLTILIKDPNTTSIGFKSFLS